MSLGHGEVSIGLIVHKLIPQDAGVIYNYKIGVLGRSLG